jgi:hypothetical protein
MHKLLNLIGIYSEHVRIQEEIHIGWFWRDRLIRVNPRIEWVLY